MIKSKQMDFLKNEALNILSNHDLNDNLKEVKCNFRKVPGTYYQQQWIYLVLDKNLCGSYPS